jgi:hypothetical protein
MAHMDLREAQLFRILSSFFGRDRVVFRMSALAVCGGQLPPGVEFGEFDLAGWARLNPCLFTIVDGDDNPFMVIEFFSGFEVSIDVAEVEHQRYLRPLLAAAGIRYITMSDDEFSDILDPDGGLDILSFLKAKVAHPEEAPV